MKTFQDQHGNNSSFRLMWALFIALVTGTWAVTAIQTKALPPFPLDSMTILALFGASALKTFTEGRDGGQK